ncbi:mechanosensitive ion channel protein 10-like [Malania oleifera]|uniref:mechanosensitive ion channel protein 10-like n=1 Tax=Malania oleifera TaxID=397392 RepID=UPI0025AE4F2A|nr:mechanosensitive ion channel protein 10-like [Malania oleifera]
MREEQSDAMEKATPNQVVLFMDQRNELADQRSRKEDTEVDTVSTGDGKLQSAVKKQTLRRLSFSKPKARLVEVNYSIPKKSLIKESNEESDPLVFGDNLSTDDDYNIDDERDEGLEEDGETTWKKYRKGRKFYWRVIIEWVMFVLITSFLLCSLTVTSLKQQLKWGIEIWKWCLMVLVIFCGHLVSGWVVKFFVFIIERKFMLREKALYFVYGLRKSFQNCMWLGVVLLAWALMFNARMHEKNKLLRKVFHTLVAFLIGATIWLVKIILVNVLASSFHVATYFDRMKESVFHHYILDTLSGPPMDEAAVLAEEEHRRWTLVGSKSLPGRWKEARNAYKSKKYRSRRIDIEKLRRLSVESTTSTWSMKRLMSYVKSFGLSMISNTLDDFGKAESEISSEWEARNRAHRIFKNVAKPGAKYIEEEDLSRFLKRVEIHTIFPLFEGALKTGRISRSSFKNWMVRAYFERKSLTHSLNDTKTAVQQLHKLASAIVSVIIIVESLMVIGLASTNIIVFVTTQVLVLIGFMFQNMCKAIFESIVFVFVMHPFDIGDRCVVDGVQMVVEEMNILTTVFLRYDMEKIYYPNSVLLTKQISNFYRSPNMGDDIDFTIDVSTSFETIVALKKAIQKYIESKPKHWNPKHSVIVKEIENVHKMTMCLCVQHTINHQNYGDRDNRVSEFLLELKKIFESLGIKYHLLPQHVHLTHVVNTN